MAADRHAQGSAPPGCFLNLVWDTGLGWMCMIRSTTIFALLAVFCAACTSAVYSPDVSVDSRVAYQQWGLCVYRHAGTHIRCGSDAASVVEAALEGCAAQRSSWHSSLQMDNLHPVFLRTYYSEASKFVEQRTRQLVEREVECL